MSPLARRANPWIAGLRGRCPACGEGPVFAGFLTVAPRCAACGFDLTGSDPGDGPAVFVMFAVGFIVVPLALVLTLAGAATWVTLGVTMSLAIGLTLGLLRPFKATLIALQHHHGAQPVQLDQADGDAP